MPGLVYWPGDGPGVTWRQACPRFTAIPDGAVIGYMAIASGDQSDLPQPTIELQLALADDPGYAHDLADVLQGWHQYLVSWVLPRIFATVDGKPPPIIITA